MRAAALVHSGLLCRRFTATKLRPEHHTLLADLFIGEFAGPQYSFVGFAQVVPTGMFVPAPVTRSKISVSPKIAS